MTDPYPTGPHRGQPVLPADKPGILQRIAQLLHPTPEGIDGLLEQLAQAQATQIIDAEDRRMLEGVLRMNDMTAGDVMVAAPRMDTLDIDAPVDDLFAQIIETAHSRFPVFEDERDNIIGILMAKDLLKLQRAPELNLRALLRPPVFVPESKRLNDLLRDFRNNRNHLAVVIDEFGNVAGLITIEDVLEEIVGEIEDEFDEDEDAGDIYSLTDKTWRINGDTAIARINEAFALALPEQDFDTIGGLVSHEMGHVPKRGEVFEDFGLRLEVMHAKGGAVRWFKVSPSPQTVNPVGND
ncbi:MAG: CBS domain-containing protein [Burkholderiaceae bacterium]|nr:CBS domain-containing protein [Burkholderiaceae bacterium]